MAVTESVSERLVRLPLWLGLEQEQVIETARRVLSADAISS